jgi:hypothetical protein
LLSGASDGFTISISNDERYLHHRSWDLKDPEVILHHNKTRQPARKAEERRRETSFLKIAVVGDKEELELTGRSTVHGNTMSGDSPSQDCFFVSRDFMTAKIEMTMVSTTRASWIMIKTKTKKTKRSLTTVRRTERRKGSIDC